MRKIIDALFDIVTIGVLVFTVLLVVNDVFMRYLLVIVGCGAMFNNCKYLFNEKKKSKKKKTNK